MYSMVNCTLHQPVSFAESDEISDCWWPVFLGEIQEPCTKSARQPDRDAEYALSPLIRVRELVELHSTVSQQRVRPGVNTCGVA